MKMNMPAIAYIYIKMAADIPYPKDDILFIPDQLYNFNILDELASVAYYAGRPDVGYMATKTILEQNRAPESEIPRIQQNFEKYKEVMQNLQSQTQQTQTNKINLEKTPEKSKTYKRRKVHS
jgi:hypothetical protein